MNPRACLRCSPIFLIGGATLTAGVCASATMTLGGTLDAQGHPNAVFILQAGSPFATEAGSQVTLAGGAQSCNVFWRVGSSATLGASSAFSGTILAHTSISSAGGVAANGRLLARDGAVTLTTTASPSRAAPHGRTPRRRSRRSARH